MSSCPIMPIIKKFRPDLYYEALNAGCAIGPSKEFSVKHKLISENLARVTFYRQNSRMGLVKVLTHNIKKSVCQEIKK